MTIKEAILKVLEDNKGAFTYLEVLKKIDEQQYIDWSNAKTPSDTIGAQLGHFIRQNDTRVKRVKGKKGFEYYFAAYENELNLSEIVEKEASSKKAVTKKYQERDLHKLLSSYLKSQNIYAKTILHEKSANSKDDHQKWIHPDMLGIRFLHLKNAASNALLKEINKSDAFTLISYELKREIKSDHELKKCFFQAVSNSSWANFGYLVAFDISKNLLDEMERLHQSFGIGIIELKANPYESDVLFPAKFKELDFKTIDKLCEINPAFKTFIEQAKSMLTAPEEYAAPTRAAFENFCDAYFKTDSEIDTYCKEKNIPIEQE
ncbi:HTH domain-containing protein [Tenacibaculum sp. 190524A02b]|uniref:HTH domain-containing protein n=1 Tax=Tenacibaculum vairaonense TaxID=3137860 RepID=UPI0031FB50FE